MLVFYQLQRRKAIDSRENTEQSVAEASMYKQPIQQVEVPVQQPPRFSNSWIVGSAAHRDSCGGVVQVSGALSGVCRLSSGLIPVPRRFISPAKPQPSPTIPHSGVDHGTAPLHVLIAYFPDEEDRLKLVPSMKISH